MRRWLSMHTILFEEHTYQVAENITMISFSSNVIKSFSNSSSFTIFFTFPPLSVAMKAPSLSGSTSQDTHAQCTQCVSSGRVVTNLMMMLLWMVAAFSSLPLPTEGHHDLLPKKSMLVMLHA